MPPDPVPPNRRDLEDRLARRSCPEPAADFRARVLSATAASRDPPAPVRSARRWRTVWRAAAAVVLALNVGMSAANGVAYRRLATLTEAEGGPARPPSGPRVPDALDADDRFQRLAASALANVRPAPDVGALGRTFFSHEEERRWVTP